MSKPMGSDISGNVPDANQIGAASSGSGIGTTWAAYLYQMLISSYNSYDKVVYGSTVMGDITDHPSWIDATKNAIVLRLGSYNTGANYGGYQFLVSNAQTVSIAIMATNSTTSDIKWVRLDNIKPLDTSPTENSTNGVTSGAVYSALQTASKGWVLLDAVDYCNVTGTIPTTGTVAFVEGDTLFDRVDGKFKTYTSGAWVDDATQPTLDTADTYYLSVGYEFLNLQEGLGYNGNLLFHYVGTAWEYEVQANLVKIADGSITYPKIASSAIGNTANTICAGNDPRLTPILAADEATALANSTANPNNVYYTVES
jgi:hypothetical protein